MAKSTRDGQVESKKNEETNQSKQREEIMVIVLVNTHKPNVSCQFVLNLHLMIQLIDMRNKRNEQESIDFDDFFFCQANER